MQDAVPTQHAFLTLSGISKRYGGVRALEDVDFACERGRIHAVLGENGAGKSTLIKIIAGVVQPDAGSMRLAGNDVSFATPSAANAAGVVCIFQELSLMPDLSVADNISIASPPRRFGLIDGRAQRRRAEALLAEIGRRYRPAHDRARHRHPVSGQAGAQAGQAGAGTGKPVLGEASRPHFT